MLNPEAPVPLYRQLADQLERRIRSGNLSVGARIPSENELAAEHGIGRPTVRQATDFLVRRGLLERRRGSGTFVLALRTPIDLFTLGGTIAAFEGAGLTLDTRLVGPVKHSAHLSKHAGPLSQRSGFTLTRLGSLSESVVLVEHMYLDAAVFPSFDTRWNEQESLSRLVERQYHRRPVGGQQTIRAHALNTREARLLKSDLGQGALLIERTLDFVAAKAAFFARIVLLTDLVALTQSLSDPMTLPPLPSSREETL